MDDSTADMECVDVLQNIFSISEKQAERLTEQVVTKLVSQMMEQTEGNPDSFENFMGGTGQRLQYRSRILRLVFGSGVRLVSGQRATMERVLESRVTVASTFELSKVRIGLETTEL